MKEKAEKIKKKLTGRRILRISVNTFLYFIIGVMIILLIAFGFTQTSMFRNWLKDTIVEEFNSSMNGEISISKLEGTIFTSVILKNTLLTQDEKAILSAEHIEVKTSPLKLLFKIIYLRKIEISNASIYLREDETGTLNVSKLFPPSEQEEQDTTSSEFPFSFQVADLHLNNVDFTLQEYSKINSSQVYTSLNNSDLRIKDLNLRLNGFADINNNSYQLSISEFSFFPNFQFFNLRNLKGDILATQNGILISDFSIVTEESEITLNAGITDINVFGDFTNEELGSAPLRVQVESEKLSFDDISTFISGLNLKSGKTSIGLSADGTLNDLFLNEFQLGFNNSRIQIIGNIKNTMDIDNLVINADLSGSVIDPEDPAKLFSESELPSYPELGIITFDTLTFKGNPVDFKTIISLNSDKGIVINGFANMNFKPENAEYNIEFNTENLDLQSFAGLKTNLNSSISINGSGFSLSSMDANIELTSFASYIGESYLDNMKLVTTIKNGITESNLELLIDSATTVTLVSNIDFNDAEDPSYTLELIGRNLNIGKMIGSDVLESNFNFDMQAEGEGFDPDSLDLFMVMNLYDSFVSDFNIDSTALIMDIRRNDNGNKIINIISDIADFTVSGQYSIYTLADVIAAETELIQTSIYNKYSFLLDEVKSDSVKLTGNARSILALEEISLNYLMDFKDFLTLRFNETEIEIDGSISGQILALEDSIAFTSIVDINYFKYWDTVDLYFLTQTKLDFVLYNKIESGLINEFSTDLFFRSNRLYTGSNFYNISLRSGVSNDSVSINFNATVEDYLDIKLKGELDVNDELQLLVTKLDSVNINYNDLNFKNAERIIINYNNSSFNFENFKLLLAGGMISLDGEFGFEGNGVVNFSGDSLQWREIGREIFGILEKDNLDSEIHLDGKLQGNFNNPKITMNLNLNNLIHDTKNIGSILSVIDYSDNNLLLDVKFIDSVSTLDSPKLIIEGIIPIEFASDENGSGTTNQKYLDLKIISENFDLASVGNAIPYVNDISGELNTVITLTGTLDDPVINGKLDIENTTFRAEVNNLVYNLETNAEFKEDVIHIQKISLGNVIGTKYGGTITGSGDIFISNLTLATAELKLKGDLKILDRVSREVNPLVYGDLAIQTDGDIHLTINEESAFIDIPINVTVADLNFQLLQSAYLNTSGFIYRFPSYLNPDDSLKNDLDSLIRISEQSKLEQSGEQVSEGYFDYRIRVNMKTEAKMVVVLSKELNQDLTAVMDGNFELTSREGRTVSTGQLNLLEGSKLSFIKSFDVTGNVRVEKLDDPILNIVATYRNYYYPVDTLGISEEIEVAVKIRFNGPLSELAQNFIRDERNIAVYVGADNIEGDQADPTKTTTDAFMFMLQGKFTDGATSQEINAAANTAANLAGSVLGGVLNKYLGDYVRNVQLRQIGSETKFNLMGRVGDFRYDIGGSTDVFQDLSRANVRIEYPIIPRLLLRIERKEAINESTLSNEIFNELGLKYRFDF